MGQSYATSKDKQTIKSIYPSVCKLIMKHLMHDSLLEEEISLQKIDTENFSLRFQSTSVKNAFMAIYQCIQVDGDVLSDGEVIDMINNFLQELGIEDVRKEYS